MIRYIQFFIYIHFRFGSFTLSWIRIPTKVCLLKLKTSFTVSLSSLRLGWEIAFIKNNLAAWKVLTRIQISVIFSWKFHVVFHSLSLNALCGLQINPIFCLMKTLLLYCNFCKSNSYFWPDYWCRSWCYFWYLHVGSWFLNEDN